MVLMFGEINIVFIFAALNYGTAALGLSVQTEVPFERKHWNISDGSYKIR